MNARHQEVINRIEYMYKDVDGNINFPNSFDGDVLKIAYKSAKASLIYLNDNQKIVLEFLKSKVTEEKVNPVNAIFILGHLWEYRRFGIEEEIKVADAYDELDSRRQAQVIEVFSEWALEQEENYNGIN